MPAIDLSADIGEGVAPADEEAALLGWVTSASVCCGAHAGTPESLSAAVSAAVSAGVVVGAHPSYPDRAGFGRHPMDMDLRALAGSLEDQLSTVSGVARSAGTNVRYVKPHGALYHQAGTDADIAGLLCRLLEQASVPVLVLSSGAATASVVGAAGVRLVTEGFADRAYMSDGSLAPRRLEGAVLTDESAVVAQALSLALDHRAPAVGGGWVEIRAQTLCLHGDTPGAARLAARVRRALEEAQVRLVPFVS